MEDEEEREIMEEREHSMGREGKESKDTMGSKGELHDANGEGDNASPIKDKLTEDKRGEGKNEPSTSKENKENEKKAKPQDTNLKAMSTRSSRRHL